MLRILAAACTALLLLSCMNSGPARRPAPPAAFDPAGFPDIPIAPGYAPLPQADLLALSIAGGALRRYHGEFALAEVRSQLNGERLLDWYRDRLMRIGWTAGPQRATRGEWHNPTGERLTIEAGRADSRAIMRISLTASRD